MNSNPASVGSGDCSRRDEAPLQTLLLVVDPLSVEARAVVIRLRRRPETGEFGLGFCRHRLFGDSVVETSVYIVAMIDEFPLRIRFEVLRSSLDERGRRLSAAAEAKAAGYGGIAAAARQLRSPGARSGRGLPPFQPQDQGRRQSSRSQRSVRTHQRQVRGVSGRRPAGDLGRHEEEGIDRRLQERRQRLSAARLSRRGQRARLRGQGTRQSRPLRSLRHRRRTPVASASASTTTPPSSPSTPFASGPTDGPASAIP